MGTRFATVRVRRGKVSGATGDVLLVPVAEGAITTVITKLGRRWSSRVRRRARAAKFRGRVGEQVCVTHDDETLVLLGTGASPSHAVWSRVGARGRREAERLSARRVTAALGGAAGDPAVLRAFTEGYHLAGYRFVEEKGNADPAKLPTLTLLGEEALSSSEAGALLADVETLVSHVCDARSLVNRPASVATPSHL